MSRLLAALLGVALALVPAGPAAARTQLIDTIPGDGLTISDVPKAVSLTFSQRVSELGAAVQVTGPDGSATAGRVRVNGRSVSERIRGDLPGGRYRVAWRVADQDGQPLSGRFSFTIAAPAPGPTSTPAAGSPATPTTLSAPHTSVAGMAADMPGMTGMEGMEGMEGMDGMDGMDGMPGMTGVQGPGVRPATKPPALSAGLAVGGLGLLVVLVVGAAVIERMRRKPSAADLPGPASD